MSIATSIAAAGVESGVVMVGLSGMGCEHSHSRETLTGHGRLDRCALAAKKLRAPLSRLPPLLNSVGATARATLPAAWPIGSRIKTSSTPRRAQPSADPGQDRAMAPDAEEPHSARKLLPAGRSRQADRRLRRAIQSPALPRKPRQSHPGRRLLRTRPDHPVATREDQAKHHRTTALATPQRRRLK